MEKRQKTITVWIASDSTEHLSEFKAEEHNRNLGEAKVLSEIQVMNKRIKDQHALKVDAIRKQWGENPELKDAFLAKLREKHAEHMREGVFRGWWLDVNEKGNPIPFPTIIKISELQPHENLMAHIMHKIGIFESISEARKNGYNSPVKPCDIWLKKKTVHLIIQK